MTTSFNLPPNLFRHPLSAAFPEMSPQHLQDLADDIAANGQRELVAVLDDQILDGWHRYLACGMANVKCVGRDFPPDADAVAYVTSKNLHRRSLTPSQRASITVALYNWTSTPDGAEGRVAHHARGEAKTNDELAAMADVSVRTVRRAKEAEAAGIADQVIAGNVSLTEVENTNVAGRQSKPKVAKVDASTAMIENLEAQVQERDLRLEVAIEELEQFRHRDLPESELSVRCDQLLREVNTYKARLNEEMEKTAALTRELNYLKKELARQ